MNRSILNRQMFAGGGAAFPDLSGDGKVTQKDILMGRGVVAMAGGGNVQYYEEGGGPEAMVRNILGGILQAGGSRALDNLQSGAVENLVEQAAMMGGLGAAETMAVILNNQYGASERDTTGAFMQQVERDRATSQAAQSDPNMQSRGAPMRPPMGMAEGGMVDEGIGAMMAQDGMATPEDAMVGTLDAAAQGIGALDASQDYEQAINSVRGDQMPIQARYEELASFVGPDDAAQTPESVLALVQPVMQMAEVDQGIGSIAPDAMGGEAPMTPEMAGGIMSNVPDAVPMEVGPPENFSQGGAARDKNDQVRYYADGGPVQYFAPDNQNRVVDTNADAELKAELDKRLGLFQELGLGSQEERARSLENQRRASKSGMLFDIADAALRFAGTPVRPGMSVASTAAESLAASKLFPRISQRADAITAFEQKQLDDKRKLSLEALTQSETSLAAKKAAEVEFEKQARNNAFQLTQLNLQQDFAKGENQSNREHAVTLAKLQNEYQLTYRSIENDNSREAIRLKASLSRQLAVLNNKARSALAKEQLDQNLLIRNLNSADQFEQISLGHKNNLAKLEKTKENEIERMKLNQEFTLKRDNHLAGIAEVSAEADRVFKAKEAALSRLQTWDVTKFNAELSKELQQNGFDETAIDREIKKTQQTFDNVLTMKQFDVQKGTADANQKYNEARLKIEQSQLSNAEKQQALENILSLRQLSLNEAIAAVDKNYKAEKIAIDKAAASAIKLDNKGDILTFISNEDRISQYARNQLGKNTSLFETVLADYFKEKPGSWDGETYVMNPAPKLPETLIKAIEQRQNNNLSVPNFSGDVGLDGKVEPQVEVVYDPKNPPNFNTNKQSWNKALLSGPNNSVQLDKNLWSSVPTNIAKDDVDYTRVVGLSAFPLGLGKSLENLGFELGFIDSISKGSIEFSEGQKDLTSIANRILLSTTNMSDDRVLKAVQEQIQAEVENIKPGILKYSTDTGASLNTVANQLASLIQKASSALPEFGGTVGGRSKATVDKRRLLMDDTINLLAEVLQIRDNFYSSYENQSKTKQQVLSKEENVNFLKNLKNKVFGKEK